MREKYLDDQTPSQIMFSHPFGISWRKALVSLPRLVPDFVLHFTSPGGPQPVVLEIPSRDSHLIPVYVFIPPVQKHHHTHHRSAGGHIKDALRPTGISAEYDAKVPVLIDFHGGSFILGSCQEQAPFCARMCRELNCVVITVDYRLGPYAQYPAANLDAEDVVMAVINPNHKGYQALREGIQWAMLKEARRPLELDEERIAFSGFSSGGNLALTLAQSVKNDPTIGKDWPSPVPWEFKNDIPVVLFYPSLDARLLPHERPRPEGLDAPSGFIERWRIERELMPTYLPADHRGHPRASPGLAEVRSEEGQHFGLHPKAKLFLVLPQFDSLNGQSLVWVKKVQHEGRGADLTVAEFKGVMHGWTQFPDSWISDEHRGLKKEAFEKAREFVGMIWNPEREDVPVQIDGEVGRGSQ